MEEQESNITINAVQEKLVSLNCNGLQVQVPKYLKSDIHKCRNLHLRIAKTSNHITFLRRCKRNKIVPKGLTPKIPAVSNKKKAMLQKQFGIIILKEQLNDLYRKRISDTKEERSVRDKLQQNLDQVSWTKIWIWILVSEKEIFLAVRERQTKKFEKLLKEHETLFKPRRDSNSKKKVMNLSSKVLTHEQVTLLEKGLHFVPRSKTRVTMDVIANTEVVSKKLGDKGQVLVHVTKNYMNNNCQGIDNLTRGERIALRELKAEDDVIITNSDKGKVVVVLDKGDYNTKMLDLLKSKCYKKLEGNPNAEKEKALFKKLVELRDGGVLENSTLTKIRKCNSKIATIYGCPKLHKEGYPLRPVVCTYGTPWSALAKFLCDIINPLAYSDESSSLRNSQHFVDMLKDLTIDDQCIILSLDVKNLFGSVPVNKCLRIMKEKLESDPFLINRTVLPIPSIMELITICVSTTFFKFGDEFYQQCEGLAMGSPLSPALATIFLDYIEKLIAKDALYVFVLFLKKFVDDYFLVWKGDKELLTDFVDFLNSIEDCIQFTVELEKDGELPFLDVKVRKVGNKLNTEMYEKDMASGVILNYRSEHPLGTKLNIVRNLTEKVKQCSQNVTNDINHLKQKFRDNNYPERIINEQVESEHSKNREKNRVKRLRLTIPFKGRQAIEFKRKTKDLNINIGFKRNKNIGEIINKMGKTNGQRSSNVVYKLNCKCGDFYVGETGRELKERMKDHERDIKNRKETSGVARHVTETGHKIDFENVEILDRENNVTKRRIREAYFIKKLKPKLNLYPGYEISDLW